MACCDENAKPRGLHDATSAMPLNGITESRGICRHQRHNKRQKAGMPAHMLEGNSLSATNE